MNERISSNESPENKEKQDDLKKKNKEQHEVADNEETKKATELNVLEASMMVEKGADMLEIKKDLEAFDTRRQMNTLQSEVIKKYSSPKETKPYLYESMSEEQIEAAANKGREQSVQIVENMVQKTSWIPDIIKRNA